MAKFQFRLATLLRLRESVRDERRNQLAQAMHADQLLLERIGSLDEELGSLRTAVRAGASGNAINLDRLLDAERYELVIKAERSAVQAQRETLKAELDRRREALVAADRDVRVLERLREVQSDRHRYEEEYRDARNLDEIAARRHRQEDLT